MDLDDIRQLDKVVDRLAAAGPSGVSAPHCWFCGKIEAWFKCDCKDAQDARDGKRNKPRVVVRDGHTLIILDPEVMEREHNRRRKRYVPPADSSVNRPSVTPEQNAPKYGGETPAAQSVTGQDASVSAIPSECVTPAVTPVSAESVTLGPDSVTPSRTAASERQRRKRERDRAARGGT